MNKVLEYICEPWRMVVAFDRHILGVVPDRLYLKALYRCLKGQKLDLHDPKTFCEKMQWLKLYNRRPEYTQLVDKYLVKDQIANTLGKEYLFPLLGKWESFDDIDFSALPDQFVLKCNHDSGSTRIIDKSSLSNEKKEELRKFYTEQLKKDFYKIGREYPYKGIKRCIIAEKYMLDNRQPNMGINDYKFFCFNGKPKLILVATDRYTDCRFDFFDKDFNHLPFEITHSNSDREIKKPLLFSEMMEIAEKLSAGMPFVRIDLYEINGRIYFGEYTFFPGDGVFVCKPEEWDRKLGDWLVLPEKYRQRKKQCNLA